MAQNFGIVPYSLSHINHNACISIWTLTNILRHHTDLLGPLPEPEGLVVARGGDEPRVGADRQAPDLAVVSVKGQHALEAVRVPLLHLAVLRDQRWVW